MWSTIHEIDKDLDSGNIIAQKEIETKMWDTSISIYNRVLDAEMDLLYNYLDKILKNNYVTIKPEKGNLNLKKDFNKLCEIDLKDTDTFLAHINKLRALTHGDYENAFFIDEKTNKKVFISINLKVE